LTRHTKRKPPIPAPTGTGGEWVVFRFEHRYTALIVSENGGFYHVDPHEIRESPCPPVQYLWPKVLCNPQLCPSDRSGCAYVYQWSRCRACPGKHELPAGSYEGCTDLLDPLNTRKKEFPEFSEALKRLRFLFKYIGGGRGIPNHAQNKG